MTTSRDWNEREQRRALEALAVTITALTILGCTPLGVDPSPLKPVAALVAVYASAIGFEAIAAWRGRRPPAFAGGVRRLAAFLLPAHVTGLVISILLATHGRIRPVVLAAVIAVASPRLFSVRDGNRHRHVFNPANLGVTAAIILLAWVGLQPAAELANRPGTGGAWVLPAVILTIGIVLTARFTRRLPLLSAWVGGVMVIAILRAVASTPIVEFLQSTTVPRSPVPFVMFVRAAVSIAATASPVDIIGAALTMTAGVGFLVYTFFVITDPATTPSAPEDQVAFGLSAGAMYGGLVAFQVAFALFFSLAIVSAVRGIARVMTNRSQRRHERPERAFAPVTVGPRVGTIGIGMAPNPAVRTEMDAKDARA